MQKRASSPSVLPPLNVLCEKRELFSLASFPRLRRFLLSGRSFSDAVLTSCFAGRVTVKMPAHAP